MGEMAQEADRPDWDNLSLLHRNALKPRANFHLYSTEDDALSRDVAKAKAQSLAGTWKFHLSDSPPKAPAGFENAAFDINDWKDIQVPGMWQRQGHGRGPHYTNVQFPFFVDPPHPPYTNNECGSYRTTFRVPEVLKDDQLRLRFEGVDSGFHVWVNGQEVGYSQGARDPSEFDITGLVDITAENTLAVRVYQFTDGSYIEDQDQWWLSGIFRDVFLLGFPKEACLEDLDVQTILDDDYRNATLKVQAKVHGTAEVQLRLLDSNKQEVVSASKKASGDAGQVECSLPVENPNKWTAETPYLYSLVLSVNGNQYTSHRVGFRQVELKDGLIKVNGKRVVFKGANRHEHHPHHGRSVPYDFMKNDLLLMKTHNLNAIRTSHQPSDPRLYDLCDELGIWVMDEADVECHGFETIADAALSPEDQTLPFFERQKLTRADAAKWTSDNPDWQHAYLDRAQQLVHRDKLHPSVVIWSLGNEAFYGRHHTAMRDWIKSYDPTRLIHYEPDLEAQHMDMHSRMYPHIGNPPRHNDPAYVQHYDIIKFAQDKSKNKPLVLCEFIHAMGTGPGNIKEYVDAFYEYEKLQGGWVWEWANHGLLTKTKDGKEFYGYGGDFGDHPNDYNFVMDGVLNSDHTPRSALIEYKKAVEPVQLVSSNDKVAKIINRLDFTTLDSLRCRFSVTHEGQEKVESGEVRIPDGIGPGQIASLELPSISSDLGSSEVLLDLQFTLREDAPWVKAGHEVALIQVPHRPISSVCLPRTKDQPKLQVEKSSTVLTISSKQSKWVLDVVQGHLSSWHKDGKAVITQPLEPTFYRALTDNDAPRDGKEWKAKFLHMATIHTRSSSSQANTGGTFSITFKQKFAPPVLSWSLNLQTEYLFSPSGTLQITIKGNPLGQNLPATLPRIGITFALPNSFQSIKWFGRGPGESYTDMKLSQPIGLHSVSSISSLWTDPEFPQECSNRTDTRWLEISSPETSITAQFLEKPDGKERHLFDFMASHYGVRDIDEAQHPFELEGQRQEDVVLRLDKAHHGLGTGSCGPKTLEKYALKTEPFEFSVVLY